METTPPASTHTQLTPSSTDLPLESSIQLNPATSTPSPFLVAVPPTPQPLESAIPSPPLFRETKTQPDSTIASADCDEKGWKTQAPLPQDSPITSLKASPIRSIVVKAEQAVFSAPSPAGQLDANAATSELFNNSVIVTHGIGGDDAPLSPLQRQLPAAKMLVSIVPVVGDEDEWAMKLTFLEAPRSKWAFRFGKCATETEGLDFETDTHHEFDNIPQRGLGTKTRLVSISDDGKIWRSWLLTAEGVRESEKETTNTVVVADARGLLTKNVCASTINSSNSKPAFDGKQQLEHTHAGKCHSSCFNLAAIAFKIILVQQLQLLSSNVTMLAVASPSLTATLAHGGNHPALAVPLVALGTHGGTVDVADVFANAIADVAVVFTNAIAMSFMVHGSSGERLLPDRHKEKEIDNASRLKQYQQRKMEMALVVHKPFNTIKISHLDFMGNNKADIFDAKVEIGLEDKANFKGWEMLQARGFFFTPSPGRLLLVQLRSYIWLHGG